MNALRVMDRYQKEVIQVSTLKNDIKVQYLDDNTTLADMWCLCDVCITSIVYVMTTRSVPILIQNKSKYPLNIS